ncbi:hypothetical protein EDD21DRAFT_429208 [Dissophora ornata]|nr:hypothetical protein EDD21DRAFT_429208 [Dissophora ornata]
MRQSTSPALTDLTDLSAAQLHDHRRSMVPSSLAQSSRVFESSVVDPCNSDISPSLTFTGFSRRSKRRTAAVDISGEISAQPAKKRSPPPPPPSSSSNTAEYASSIVNAGGMDIALSNSEDGAIHQSLAPTDTTSCSDLGLEPKNKDSEPPIVTTATQSTRPSSSSSSTSKRPNRATSKIVGHSSSPKSIQFINNIAPVVPRPKPPKGVYIQTHSAMQQKARKQLRDEGKNKRSSNCFILYRTRMHPLIVAQYGNQNNKEISKIAGQCWKREPESVKTIYRQMAYDERQKRESLYHSFKSPAAKITGHNPKNVVGDASALSSSSLSSQLSPATEGAARFAASGSNCSQDSDIEPTLASKPERTVKKSNSSNQGLTKKPSQEKKFVVTETALHEFIGDSDLAVKTRNAPKNRTNTSAQPPARRSSKIKSENTNLYGGSATPSVLGELGTSIMANVDFPREFTFVAEGPAATLPTFPATFPQLQQGAISSNSSASPLTFTSFESDSSPSSTLYANLSLAGSALPTSHGWNCESVPLRSDMIPSILDMPIEFDLSLPDTAATTGMLCKGKYPAESGTQQLDLPLPLHLTSQGVELAHPTSVHDPPGCTHSPFLALQQQQQRQSGPFQTTVPCSTNLNQGYPWDLSAFTDSESSTFDNVRHFDSSKTTPIGNAATLFAMEVPMLSSSPLTPMPTPHLMVSTTALGRKSTNNRHTIVQVQVKFMGLGIFG